MPTVLTLRGWRLAGAIVACYAALFTLAFSEPLLSGRLLAPGDGWAVHLSAFYAPWTLWSPDIYSGFPIAAEPLTQSYYPPAWLFSHLGAWNAYVITAYVLAASFTCGYVYALTGSAVAGLVAGTIYGMSGFFFGHLGHITILHGAAWIPLLFWALEGARRGRGSGWLVVAAAAVALCTLGTHPQVLVYGLGLAAAYVLVMGASAARGRWRYYAASGAAVLAGLAAAAVQLLPTAELGYLSLRSAMTLEESASFALPVREALQPLFPFLYGAAGLAPYGTPYFGTWTLTETGGYVGWLACLAALTAVIAAWREPLVAFWALAALVSFLLALGPATPLWWAAQQLPGYGWFRCPARHFLEVSFGLATLAGLGVAALSTPAGRHAAARAAGAILLFAAAAALLIGWESDFLLAGAAARGLAHLSGWFWVNAAVAIPLLVAFVSAAAFLWYARDPSSRTRAALLVLVAAADLASAGRWATQTNGLPDAAIVEMPAALAGVRARVRAEASRVFSYDPGGPPASAPFNLSRLWGIANANGASSIALLRYATAVPWVDPRVFAAENQVLDLLATRYVTRAWRSEAGVEWGTNIEAVLDRRTGPRLEWTVPDVWASRLALVGALRGAALVADGTPVATLRVVTAGGEIIERSLRAGDDLSDAEHDRPGPRWAMHHRKAHVLETFPMRDARHGDFQMFGYLTAVDLGGRRRVRRIELERSDPMVGVSVRRASLNDAETGVSYAIEAGLSDATRWRPAGDFGGVALFENQRTLPRAWLAAGAVTLRSGEVLQAIQRSVLPDGSPFDPRRTALVEEPVALPSTAVEPDGEVGVTVLADTRIELDARTARDAFLVLSEVYYPGWNAHIDGRPVHVYQTDFLLRGVVLPAGRHTVTFTYAPRSFFVGLTVSLVSVAALLAVALRALTTAAR